MQSTFRITAASRPQVLMRLVHLFDQQSLVIRSLKLSHLDNRVVISLSVEVDAELAGRLQARLFHQTDVQNVELLAG